MAREWLGEKEELELELELELLLLLDEEEDLEPDLNGNFLLGGAIYVYLLWKWNSFFFPDINIIR